MCLPRNHYLAGGLARRLRPALHAKRATQAAGKLAG
jgi:hypothetical protein